MTCPRCTGSFSNITKSTAEQRLEIQTLTQGLKPEDVVDLFLGGPKHVSPKEAMIQYLKSRKFFAVHRS